jgi:thiol:disulfide interchange protein
MTVQKILRGGWIALALLLIAGLAYSAMESLERVPALEWGEDYEAALKQAHAAHKPVLVDLWAPWCGYCFEMERTTLADRRVREMAKAFVCVKVNADRRPDLMERFHIAGLPAIVFLRPDGKAVQKATGLVDAVQMTAVMEEVRAKTQSASGTSGR